MKEIKLNTRRGSDLVALVDDSDYEFINQWKWYADKIGNTFYAKRRVRCDGKSTTVSMHRVITNANVGQDVDHEDHNGLNNQKNNLRICSRSQNQWNRNKNKRNTSGFTGVFFDKSRNKWVAVIMANYKSKRIGRFNSKKEAAIAYNSAALKLHGEFSVLNTIE